MLSTHESFPLVALKRLMQNFIKKKKKEMRKIINVLELF